MTNPPCNLGDIGVGFVRMSTLLRIGSGTRREGKHVMWQRLSLRGRINLLLALVLTLGLAVNVARLVLEAAPRVQAEDQSVTRLAREFVETIVTGLNEAPDPETRLDEIVQDLKRLRHVRIALRDDAGMPAANAEASED